MKKYLEVLLIGLVFTFSCSDDDSSTNRQQITPEESVQFDVTGIVLVNTTTTKNLEVTTSEGTLSGSFTSGTALFEAELGTISISVDQSIMRILDGSTQLKTIDFEQNISTLPAITEEQIIKVSRLFAVLGDIDVNPMAPINNSSWIGSGGTGDTECSAHFSKRRANRELKDLIGGCPEGQEFDSDCICALGDYGCVCCGDCG